VNCVVIAGGAEVNAAAAEFALAPPRKELLRENLRQPPSGGAVNSAVAGAKWRRKSAELRPIRSKRPDVCALFWGESS
jgi:hypothetical protein